MADYGTDFLAHSLNVDRALTDSRSGCRLYDTDGSSDDSYTYHQVTHDDDTSSFYWHGSRAQEYGYHFADNDEGATPSRNSPSLVNKTPAGFRDRSWSAGVTRPALDKSVKIIVIGDPGVGKTSLIQRYVNKQFSNNYKWTIGVDFALKLIPWSDSINIKLQLWDIAGQERFTSMTRVYYKDAHASIIMFDLSQRASFLNALKWKKDLDQKCQLPDGAPVPCLLLANKCDLQGREVDQIEIEAFSREQNFIGWTETSVKLDLMVEESMRFLLEDVVSRCTEPKSNLEPVVPILRLKEMSPRDRTTECIC